MPEAEPDSACLACHEPLRYTITSKRGVTAGLPPRSWFTLGLEGTVFCLESESFSHVPVAEPDRVREWLDA